MHGRWSRRGARAKKPYAIRRRRLWRANGVSSWRHVRVYGRFAYCSQCGTRMTASQAFICRAAPGDTRCGVCLDRAGEFHADAADYPSALAIPASVWHR